MDVMIRSHSSSPCRGPVAPPRRSFRAAARPTVLVIMVSVVAALLMAAVCGRLMPFSVGGTTSWAPPAGVRVGPNAGSGGPLATVPDPLDRRLGGLLSPDFNDSSCLSRYRVALYRRPSLHAVSSHLVSALRRYESLHRRCGPASPAFARAVQRLLRSNASASTTTTTSSSSSGSGSPSCSYVVWKPTEGLGNRMLSITSAFLYALLTDRVLLLHRGTGDDLDDLFCEPFPGSTWILPSSSSDNNSKDDGLPIIIPGIEQLTDRNHQNSLGSVLRRGGEDPGNNNSTAAAPPPWLYVHLRHDYTSGDDHHDQRFFCDDVQAQLLGRVPWLVFLSDNYVVPGLFLVPRHGEELARMFPRRDAVFHHLGRYLFSPSNTVWRMVTRYHEESGFGKAGYERVGIQVRRFPWWPPISADELFGQILNCSQREDILPAAGDVDDNKTTTNTAKQKVAVLVVSLHGEYAEKLRGVYHDDGHGASTSSSVVSVYQPTQLGEQSSGEREHNQKALAEMVLLSFADAVVTTAVSTFGYVGQGLAGLRPWVLMSPVGDGKAPPDTPCRRAATMEPCFHAPPSYDCRTKKANGDAGRMVRHVRHCEDIPQGVQLVE